MKTATVRDLRYHFAEIEARARKIFGDKVTTMTGTEIVSEGRERY